MKTHVVLFDSFLFDYNFPIVILHGTLSFGCDGHLLDLSMLIRDSKGLEKFQSKVSQRLLDST